MEKDANFPFEKKHANGYFSLSGEVYFTPTTVISENVIKAGFDEAVVDYASHTLFANPDLKKDLTSALDEAFDQHLQDISSSIDETTIFISRFHTEKLGLIENSVSPTSGSYTYNDLLQVRETSKSLTKEISKYQGKIQDITASFKDLRTKLAKEWEGILVKKFKEHCTEASEDQLDQVLAFLKLLGLKLKLGEPSFVGAAKDLLGQLERCSIEMRDRISEKENQHTKELEDRIRFQEDIIKETLNHPDAQNLLPHLLARLNELRPTNVNPDRTMKNSVTNIDTSLINKDDDLLE